MTHIKSSRLNQARDTALADEEADGGPELDSTDSRAMRKLAERAGLVPARRKPTAPIAETHTARGPQGPTSTQVWKIADLLVGDGLTLPLNVLAIIADARAAWQDDKGGKSAASQYRHCAHHLRQAADTIARADDTTDEECAATADMTSAYVEAAATHAREAALSAI